MEALFRSVDSKHNGQIDLKEWVVTSLNHLHPTFETALDLSFRSFDADGSGTLSWQEVYDMLLLNLKTKIRRQKYSVSFPLKNIVVPADQLAGIKNSVDSVFKAMHKSSNGRLSHTDFISGVKKVTQLYPLSFLFHSNQPLISASASLSTTQNAVVRDQLRDCLRLTEMVK